MSILGFILLLIIAGICGAIAQAIVGWSRSGILGSIAIGFVGALIGVWLARALDLPMLLAVNIDGQSFPIVWSILGAALFTAVLALIMGSRRRRYIRA